ncbi:unnamed protein product [Ceutorhynchus assimilis]|uniref:Cytochrome P450 n=1 Tax=Ceutorhynchus assimilis TaxID=467358 RepID=A0A9N9QMN4_9CUCU|nr:unnamed protein product [Ceutorhynchus assimilis]
MDCVWLITCICAFPLLILLISKWYYSYWKRRGVVQLDPEFLFGDMRDMLTGKVSTGGAYRNIYSTFKSKNLKYGGIYLAFNPVFIPLDLQLIKDIMLKSFIHFQDRGNNNNESDILTQNLFRIEGEHWKQLRNKLSPTFTSSRMKMMFETLNEKTYQFKSIIDRYIETDGKINMTDFSGRFTTDVIGSCAFGIECDSLANPDCDFRVYGKKVNTPSRLKQWMENVFPRKLLAYTGFKMFGDVEDFYVNIVSKTIEHREKNQVFRKDFMHLLLQLRNRGVLSDDGKFTKENNETGILRDDEIVAQCFIFFVAGFDTSSVTMTMALYEVAKNIPIQDKMRNEIQQVLKKYDGKLTYEGAKEMEFVEKVILETLRKYPVVPSIPRVCTKNYIIPGTNIKIEKGTKVEISVWGIHMDPEYYPDPELFDPERFSNEEKAKRPDFAYMPFGEGPRICIGSRFGMLQTKIGLAGLLKDYKYTFCKDTPENLSFKPSLILLHPKEEIILNVEKI